MNRLEFHPANNLYSPLHLLMNYILVQHDALENLGVFHRPTGNLSNVASTVITTIDRHLSSQLLPSKDQPFHQSLSHLSTILSLDIRNSIHLIIISQALLPVPNFFKRHSTDWLHLSRCQTKYLVYNSLPFPLWRNV